MDKRNASLSVSHLGPLNELAVLVKSQAEIFSTGRRRHRTPYPAPRARVMAVTSAAKAKAEGESGALPQNPLRNSTFARFADHVRLAQLGQSFPIGIYANTAPPVVVRDGAFSAGGTAPSQEDHDNE